MAKKSSYPEEVAAFIHEHSKEYSVIGMVEELKTRFGFEKTYDAIKNYLTRNHLRTLPRKGRECPEKSKFPTEMRTYLREIAPGRSYKEILQMVNDKFGDGTIDLDHLHAYLKRYKIKTGRTGHFQKGQESWNKGKKLEEIVKDPEARKRCEEGRFKPGNIAVNTLPIGSIVKSSDGYLVIKKQTEGIQRQRWRFLHRAVWEEHNGPIPEGMYISFKDGNKLNCDIDNLMLISKGENVMLTNLGFRSADPALTEAGLQVVRIKRKCKELIEAKK